MGLPRSHESSRQTIDCSTINCRARSTLKALFRMAIPPVLCSTSFLQSSFITHSTGRRPALARRPPQDPRRTAAFRHRTHADCTVIMLPVRLYTGKPTHRQWHRSRDPCLFGCLLIGAAAASPGRSSHWHAILESLSTGRPLPARLCARGRGTAAAGRQIDIRL